MRVHLVDAAPLAAQPGPGGLGLRLLFALGVLLLLVALVGGMRRSWVRRAEQQEDELPDLPVPPEDPGTVIAAPLRGMYLGTVDAGHWLEWIAARGAGGRAGGYVTVYQTGVQVDRDGTAFWIPREAVRGARLERAHAGKVAAPGRLVVIAWSYGDHELETGFRGEDRARQPKVVRAVHDLIGPATAAPAEGEITNPRGMQRGRLRLRARTDGGPQLPGARGGRIPVARPPQVPAAPVDPLGQAFPAGRGGAQTYPGARPYARLGLRNTVDPAGPVGPHGPVGPVGPHGPVGAIDPWTGGGQRQGSEPHGAPQPRRVPDRRGVPDRRSVPDRRGAGEPYGGHPTTPIPVAGRATPPGPGPERPGWAQSRQPRPERAQPEWPPVEPAASPLSAADAAYVDPLTSPLGEVVRQMHDDR